VNLTATGVQIAWSDSSGGHSQHLTLTVDGLKLNSQIIGTQCANVPAIDPEVTAADAAFNTQRDAMIASGLMAPDPS
jgi:hypothetical protein